MINFKKILCLTLTFILIIVGSSFNASASKQSELENEISRLENESKKIENQISSIKGQEKNKQSLVNLYQQKISNTESQIIACNNEISKLNGKISKNKADIKEQEEAIAKTKEDFKKRLRAIYMNKNSSNIAVLLGADNFSDFLQLEQLTASVSQKDKKTIEDITSVMKDLQKKKEENEKILNSQIEIKNTISKKQKDLELDRKDAANALNSLKKEEGSLNVQNANIEKELKAKKAALDDLFASLKPSTDNEFNGSFYWPVPGFHYISQQFGKTSFNPYGHSGCDIAGRGIAGQPVVAVADGVVSRIQSHWTPALGYRGMASYGNYVIIDHGRYNGKQLYSYYAHLSKTNAHVGQRVKGGQNIGYVGTTGNSTGYHLHMEFRFNRTPTDPMQFIGRSR